MSIVDYHDSVTATLLNQYRASKIEFREYVSKIDGTRQYYRICENTADPESMQLLVVLPTSESQVRKHLESFDVANLIEAEVLAELGEEYGITIVWPGLVEVDCGGDLSRRALDECLANIKAEYAPIQPSVFLLGTCSSGLLAVGYAATRDVDGLILQSPTIYRSSHRWLDGLDVDGVVFPEAALAAEAPSSKWDALNTTPVYFTFNTDLPGHGDREGSRALCDHLRASGTSIVEHWPEPEHYFAWGERARIQEIPMFEWVARRRANLNSAPRREQAPPAEHKASMTTVKDCLLSGFTVAPAEDHLLRDWSQHWLSVWESFRGAKWQYSSEGRSSATKVVFRVLEDSDFTDLHRGIFSSGDAIVISESTAEITGADDLFGYRLRVDPRTSKGFVEVFRSRSAKAPLPGLDLVVDGCCTGAIWRKNEKNWELAKVWLPTKSHRVP